MSVRTNHPHDAHDKLAQQRRRQHPAQRAQAQQEPDYVQQQGPPFLTPTIVRMERNGRWGVGRRRMRRVVGPVLEASKDGDVDVDGARVRTLSLSRDRTTSTDNKSDAGARGRRDGGFSVPGAEHPPTTVTGEENDDRSQRQQTKAGPAACPCLHPSRVSCGWRHRRGCLVSRTDDALPTREDLTEICRQTGESTRCPLRSRIRYPRLPWPETRAHVSSTKAR
jgi:hypothetical protein